MPNRVADPQKCRDTSARATISVTPSQSRRNPLSKEPATDTQRFYRSSIDDPIARTVDARWLATTSETRSRLSLTRNRIWQSNPCSRDRHPPPSLPAWPRMCSPSPRNSWPQPSADAKRRPLPAQHHDRFRTAWGLADGRPTVFRIRSRRGPDRIDALKRRDDPRVRASGLQPRQSSLPHAHPRHDHSLPDLSDPNHSIVRSLFIQSTLSRHSINRRSSASFRPDRFPLGIQGARNRIISRPGRSGSNWFGFIRGGRPRCIMRCRWVAIGSKTGPTARSIASRTRHRGRSGSARGFGAYSTREPRRGRSRFEIRRGAARSPKSPVQRSARSGRQPERSQKTLLSTRAASSLDFDHQRLL